MREGYFVISFCVCSLTFFRGTSTSRGTLFSRLLWGYCGDPQRSTMGSGHNSYHFSLAFPQNNIRWCSASIDKALCNCTKVAALSRCLREQQIRARPNLSSVSWMKWLFQNSPSSLLIWTFSMMIMIQRVFLREDS